MAIEDLISSHGTQAVGRIIGHAHTTVMRRDSEPGNWPLSDALLLADADDHVRLAIAARLRLHHIAPHSTEQDALASVRDAGEMIAGICKDLKDQRIHPREARLRLVDVRRALESLAQLEADLDQRAAEEAPRG